MIWSFCADRFGSIPVCLDQEGVNVTSALLPLVEGERQRRLNLEKQLARGIRRVMSLSEVSAEGSGTADRVSLGQITTKDMDNTAGLLEK